MKNIKNVSHKPDNAFVGDVIPFYDNGKYYAYYLHDPRKKGPGIYAEETTWNLITTSDGVSFEDKGRVLPLGNEETPYLNNYTGSVIKAKDGFYYAFFTAFNDLNDEYKIDGKAVQSVMVAKGDTPDTLKIIEDSRFIGDNQIYEIYDWRDPYVFYNEDENCYWMLLCARAKGSSYHRGGCIALCKSNDLIHWSYEKPYYEPNMYITMECPELFKMGSWWYLVFSTFSDRFVTHYRVSKSPYGPWTIPYEDSLDCRSDYAIKSAGTDSERFAFGWISTKLGACDNGPWEWGGTMIVHKLTHDEKTGKLAVSMLPAVAEQYPVKVEDFHFKSINIRETGGIIYSEGLGAKLYKNDSNCFIVDAQLSVDASEFGFFIASDEILEEGYQLRIGHGMVSLDRWPRQPHGEDGIYQWQIKGDMPFAIELVRYIDPSIDKYHIQVVRYDEILLVYINDEVVLSTRIYSMKTGFDGFYVIGGSLSINSFEIRKKGERK